MPSELRRPVTRDQGNEWRWHREFTIATGMAVYSCDPKSPSRAGRMRTTAFFSTSRRGPICQFTHRQSSIGSLGSDALDLHDNIVGCPKTHLVEVLALRLALCFSEGVARPGDNDERASASVSSPPRDAWLVAAERS